MFVVMKFYSWNHLEINENPVERIENTHSVGFLHVYENLEDIQADYEDEDDEVEYLIINFKEKESEGDEKTYH